MGDKSAQNIIGSVGESKKRGLTRVLTALGIRHVGENNARLLAREFGNIASLMAATEERLAQIPGVGPIVAESVYKFFHSNVGIQTIKDLESRELDLTETVEKKESLSQSKLDGKTIVVTGTMARFSRAQMEELIRNSGGKTTSTVSKRTDYVIAGDNPGSKRDKAKELGIEVLSEEEFEKMLVGD
jgi:DNA ligase (NAD+)